MAEPERKDSIGKRSLSTPTPDDADNVLNIGDNDEIELGMVYICPIGAKTEKGHLNHPMYGKIYFSRYIDCGSVCGRTECWRCGRC